MNGLFHHWLLSLSTLRPSFFPHFVLRAARNFATAVATMMWHFPWVLGVDLICVALFGGKIISFMNSALEKQPVAPHPIIVGSMLIIGIMTFLMQVFFVLFLRRDHFLLNPRAYIQTYVFKYVQFVFFLAFVTTLFRLILFFIGVIQIPYIPELVLFLLRTFALFALFFWLDAVSSIKSLIRSFERAANLLVYTLPFVLFIAVISFGVLALLIGVVLGWDKVLQAPYALASFTEFFVGFSKQPALWQVLVIKYGSHVINGCTVAFLYTWYRRRRGEGYATSLFEGPTDS